MLQSLGSQAFFIFLATNLVVHIVEGVLHILQGFSFSMKPSFFFFKVRFFLCDRRFQFYTAVDLLLLLVVQVAVGDIESFQRGFGQFYADLLVFLLDLKVFLRFLPGFPATSTGY